MRWWQTFADRTLYDRTKSCFLTNTGRNLPKPPWLEEWSTVVQRTWTWLEVVYTRRGPWLVLTSVVSTPLPPRSNAMHPAGYFFTYLIDPIGDTKFKASHKQYFLADKLEFLDQADKWFYDKNAITVSVKTLYGKMSLKKDTRQGLNLNQYYYRSIIPVGIVAYAFTLLWDRFYAFVGRKSCI